MIEIKNGNKKGRILGHPVSKTRHIYIVIFLLSITSLDSDTRCNNITLQGDPNKVYNLSYDRASYREVIEMNNGHKKGTHFGPPCILEQNIVIFLLSITSLDHDTKCNITLQGDPRKPITYLMNRASYCILTSA